jgi:hypothetical protein
MATRTQPEFTGTTASRLWIAAFILMLAVFGFGQLEAWPFTSWYMFSHVEASTISVARAVVVEPNGHERVLGADALPLGLLSHRLLGRTESDQQEVCDALTRAAKDSKEIRIERVTWRPLERDGDRPADVRTEVIFRCE